MAKVVLALRRNNHVHVIVTSSFPSSCCSMPAPRRCCRFAPASVAAATRVGRGEICKLSQPKQRIFEAEQVSKPEIRRHFSGY